MIAKDHPFLFFDDRIFEFHQGSESRDCLYFLGKRFSLIPEKSNPNTKSNFSMERFFIDEVFPHFQNIYSHDFIPTKQDSISQRPYIHLFGEFYNLEKNRKAKGIFAVIDENLYSLNHSIDSSIRSPKKYETRTHHGYIGYERKFNNSFLLYYRFDPFLVELNGNYFSYEEGITIGTTLKRSFNRIKVTSRPNVLYQEGNITFANYGTICYGQNMNFLLKHCDFEYHNISALEGINYAKNVATILHNTRIFIEKAVRYNTRPGDKRQTLFPTPGIRVIRLIQKTRK